MGVFVEAAIALVQGARQWKENSCDLKEKLERAKAELENIPNPWDAANARAAWASIYAATNVYTTNNVHQSWGDTLVSDNIFGNDDWDGQDYDPGTVYTTDWGDGD